MNKFLFALLAGAILPLAFAPFGFFPLAVVSLSAFFFLCLDTSANRAFKTGIAYSLGYFGVGVSWLQISIHQFGLPFLPFSISMTILFILVIAMLPALTAYSSVRFFKPSSTDNRLKLLIILPTLWIIFEWVRSWVFTGFPWLTVGYSQIDSPLAGFAAITGIYGLSLIVAVSAGALALLVHEKRWMLSLTVIIPLWIGGFVLNTIEWTNQNDESVDVALVQGNVAQDIKWLPAQKQVTLDLYTRHSEPFWDKVDLIIWPETALPAFAHDIPDFLGTLQLRAEESNTDLLLGLPVADPETKKYYNAVISLGDELNVYKKAHLVPFGEYLPLRELLDPILQFLSIPMSNFSRGEANKTLIKTSKYDIGISICYEDVFGEEVITGLPDADFLVNVSNDAWFGDSLAPHQHLEMARMRALETGRYLVRATNTGVSAIIDQKGSVIKQIPQFEETTLTATIFTYSGATPYVKLGNLPIIIFCFIMVGFCFTRAHGES